MERSQVRELLRLAQSSELKGDLAGAARLLEQASGMYLDSDRPGRAATLLRHALRLDPGRSELEAMLARIEQPAEASSPARGQLEMPERGPVPADPSIDCWCSFCCRPKAEVGSMIAGSSGTFICTACIQAAQLLAAWNADSVEQPRPPIAPREPVPLLEDPDSIDLPLGPVVEAPLLDARLRCTRPTMPAAPRGLGGGDAQAAAVTPARSACDPSAATIAEGSDDGLIPAAVILSRELGWSLTEIRSLSIEERRQAVALAAPGRRS